MPKKQKEELTLILGCGRLGAGLANAISDANGNVIIIDKDPDAFRKLSPSFGGITIVGPGTDVDVLENARIKEASALICVTDRENINIFTALMAKQLYNVPKVILRVHDRSKEELYQDMGIEVICPSELTTSALNDLFYRGEANE